MTDVSALKETIAKARRDLADGRQAEAWQTMADLLRQFPDEPNVALSAGFVGLRSGHAQEAIVILQSLTDKYPEFAMGWALLGETLVAVEQFALALPALQRAAGGFPADGMVQYLLGVAQERCGEWDSAVASFRRALKVAPQNHQILAVVGFALANLNENDDAIAVLTRAANTPSAPFVVHARLASLLLHKSGYAVARYAFDAAVASIKASLRAGRFDEALLNERELDHWFVRPIENEEHTERCFATWRDAMTEAGTKAAALLPALPPPSQAGATAPIVGFFLHAASLLGHIELTLDYLSVMRTAHQIEPRIYVFSGSDPDLRDEARRRGLAISFVDAEWRGGTELKPYQRLLWLRDRLARDGVATLVWVSVPDFVHFGAALGVAPINIFWALRFRPVASSYVQGSIACASCFEREDMVNGRRWDIIPLAFRDLAGPPRGEKAAAIRRQLGHPKIVFGSLARTEKMQGDNWLKAVGLTLKACPEAVFLWTGESEDPHVAGALREMGVAGQSRFVGWVDTRLYAQVLDIFLDTAPVGCGLTAMQAMAWGKPLVSFKDPLTNWGQCLRPVLEGKVVDQEAKAAIENIFALGSDNELLAWAETPKDYAALAIRLAQDPEFRASVGTAGKAFTDRYFGNPVYAAERFAAAIHAVIARANG